MKVNKEIRELKESFHRSGPLTRTLLIFSFITSLSSVTSISSLVFEWKGFILDGLRLYQNYFVSPVISLASEMGLEYSTIEIHVATVSSISAIVGMRVLAMGHSIAIFEINSRYGSELKPDIKIYWLVAIILTVGVWSWYGVSNPIIRPWSVIIFSASAPIFITAPKIIMSKFGYEQFEKGRFSYIKSYYAYIAVIIIIVGVLAAINSGLK